MKKVVLASIFTMIALLGVSCYKFYSIDESINVTVDTKSTKDTFGANNNILLDVDNQNIVESDNNSTIINVEKEESKTSNVIPEKQNVVTENVVSEKTTTTTQEEVKENIVESNVVVEEAKEETTDNKVESNDNNSQNSKFNIKDREKLSDKLITSDETVKVVDKSNGAMCAQAIEYFYEDAYYKYYFNCIKSSYMYVIKNGKEYKLIEALKTGIVTMQELEENGYKFPKKSKNVFAK